MRGHSIFYWSTMYLPCKNSDLNIVTIANTIHLYIIVTTLLHVNIDKYLSTM